MRKLVAAIDLGTSKVVCLVGEKTDAGIKIIALSEAPTKGVSRGEVVNIQSALDSMIPTIQNVENAIGEKIQDVFIGIAGQNIKCIQGTNQTTRVNPDELITLAEIEEITRKMHSIPLNLLFPMHPISHSPQSLSVPTAHQLIFQHQLNYLVMNVFQNVNH